MSSCQHTGQPARSKHRARFVCPEGAQGDFLGVKDKCICMLDVSAVHVPEDLYRHTAAMMDSVAAAHRDAAMITTHARHDDACFSLVPFSVDMLRRLGAPAARSLTDLGMCATADGDRCFPRQQLVLGVLRELFVALGRWSARVANCR
jgi:hypothetical protein